MGNDISNIVLKSFVQHAISFIEHKIVYPEATLASSQHSDSQYSLAEITYPIVHQIQNTARSANYDSCDLAILVCIR